MRRNVRLGLTNKRMLELPRSCCALRLVSLKEGFIVGGIMIGFAASSIFESSTRCEGGSCPHQPAGGFDESDVFRAVWALPLLISPLVVAGMKNLPASPRWTRASHPSAARMVAALFRSLLASICSSPPLHRCTPQAIPSASSHLLAVAAAGRARARHPRRRIVSG